MEHGGFGFRVFEIFPRLFFLQGGIEIFQFRSCKIANNLINVPLIIWRFLGNRRRDNFDQIKIYLIIIEDYNCIPINNLKRITRLLLFYIL